MATEWSAVATRWPHCKGVGKRGIYKPLFPNGVTPKPSLALK
jgi:hypothetical protein